MASSRPAITALDFYFLGVVFLIWTATCIRFPRMRLRFARAIGRIAYRLSGTKRRHSERNIAEAFEGKLTPERVRMITRRSFQQFWLEVFSMPAPMVQELGRAHIEFRGLEHLRHALGKNRGVILWESNSFGSKFLAKKSLYQQGFAVHQIYGDNYAGGFVTPCPASRFRLRVIKRFFDQCEKQYVAEILNLPVWQPLPVMRVLFERLRQNAIMCIAGNGTLGWQGIRKNFLGTDRVFFTGMASLSRVAGAPILPLFCVQEANGTVAVIIEPPILEDACLDRERAAEICIDRYVALLEFYVRKHPEQYSGWHSLGTWNIVLPAEERSHRLHAKASGI